MLKQLRRRFILLAVISMAVTLIVSFTAVNFALRFRLAERTDVIIEILYENDGVFPIDYYLNQHMELYEETPYQTRYYVAYIDNNRAIIGADYSHIAINNIEGVGNQINEILGSGKEKGYIGTYRFGCFDNGDGTKMIVVVDCQADLETMNTLLAITLITIITCIIIVLILLILLSKYVLKPFEENREKQRRFITDAGHELKTPIAIIQSNAEVIEMIDGENKWLNNIKAQTSRMSRLVKGLIELSKMDEQTLSEKEKQKILVTDIVSDSVESFRVMAESKGIEIKAELVPNVYLYGDLEDIVRLVGILIDNAVKYTDSRGEIRVQLFNKAKKVCLIVSNTCEGLDRKSVPKFFDRFYRSDSSRSSENGGYGIGLSMAQMIVQNHKGKISVSYTDDERVVFTVEF